MPSVPQVMHQGPTMWIVNKFGWIGNGNIDQCVCVTIREGGNSSNPNPIYPINPSWVDNLVYIGREVIGVEYLSDDLTDVELDHWAFGPHHLWSYPENGQILRMWQPFNGLQVGGPVTVFSKNPWSCFHVIVGLIGDRQLNCRISQSLIKASDKSGRGHGLG